MDLQKRKNGFENAADGGKRPSFLALIFNHVDAWQVALIIAALALLIHQAVTIRTTMLLLAVGVGYWLGFAVNDYYDAPVDAQDVRKAGRNFFINRVVPRQSVGLFFVGISSGLLGVFGQFGSWGILFFVLAYGAMWAYSAPPLRLKDRPGVDLLMHVLFVQTFPYVMMMTLIQATWTMLDVALVVLLALASLSAQLEQQARDFEVDRQNGRNSTIWLGYQNAIYLVRGITAVLIAIAFYFIVMGVIPWFVLPFGVIGLPALLHRFFRNQRMPRSEWLVILSTTTGFLYTGIIFFYFLLR